MPWTSPGRPLRPPWRAQDATWSSSVFEFRKKRRSERSPFNGPTGTPGDKFPGEDHRPTRIQRAGIRNPRRLLASEGINSRRGTLTGDKTILDGCGKNGSAVVGGSNGRATRWDPRRRLVDGACSAWRFVRLIGRGDGYCRGDATAEPAKTHDELESTRKTPPHVTQQKKWNQVNLEDEAGSIACRSHDSMARSLQPTARTATFDPGRCGCHRLSAANDFNSKLKSLRNRPNTDMQSSPETRYRKGSPVPAHHVPCDPE